MTRQEDIAEMANKAMEDRRNKPYVAMTEYFMGHLDEVKYGFISLDKFLNNCKKIYEENN